MEHPVHNTFTLLSSTVVLRFQEFNFDNAKNTRGTSKTLLNI